MKKGKFIICDKEINIDVDFICSSCEPDDDNHDIWGDTNT